MAKKMWGIFILLTATTVAQAAKYTTHKINWGPGAVSLESQYAGKVRVGDTLMFIYKAGEHNLIEVDKDGYENCIVSPSAKVHTSDYGEDVLFIDAPGPRYFICGFGQHCKIKGMKLKIVAEAQSVSKIQIDVHGHKETKSSSGPTHSEFMVGDDKGWNENVDYKAWAKGKEFYMGDMLAFTYTEGKHNVLKVDEAALNKCIIPKDKNETLASGYDQFTLMSMGNIGFVSGIGKDCENGMKLLINVKCPRTRPKPPALRGGRKLVP